MESKEFTASLLDDPPPDVMRNITGRFSINDFIRSHTSAGMK